MSEMPLYRRRSFILSAAALGGAAVLPGLSMPSAQGAPAAASDLSDRLAEARSGLKDGQQRLVRKLEGGDLWVQKYRGAVSTQLVAVGEPPMSPESVATAWNDGAPEGAEESVNTDPKAIQPMASSCAMATATASILTALGGTALAALAIANPAGVVLGGVFFSASMLNYAALIAGSYSATVGWLGAILC